MFGKQNSRIKAFWNTFSQGTFFKYHVVTCVLYNVLLYNLLIIIIVRQNKALKVSFYVFCCLMNSFVLYNRFDVCLFNDGFHCVSLPHVA